MHGAQRATSEKTAFKHLVEKCNTNNVKIHENGSKQSPVQYVLGTAKDTGCRLPFLTDVKSQYLCFETTSRWPTAAFLAGRRLGRRARSAPSGMAMYVKE
jgi:hypothetical protein